MSTTTDSGELRFRTFKQYKDHFAPTPEEPDYTGKSPEYIMGAEIARKAFEAAKRRIEKEKKRAPWEK
jgi:hypothetical protein